MKLANRDFVVYHYFERDALYRDNLAHFLRFGLLPELDYLFIIQGDSAFPLFDFSNVSVLNVSNEGLDYGGISQAVAAGRIPSDRERYFFLNSSIRGPFVPPWLQGHWPKAFDPLFNAGFDLVGATRNSGSLPDAISPHIQTTAYGLSGRAWKILTDMGFFRQRIAKKKIEIIEQYEIGLTRRLEGLGLRVGSLVPDRIWHRGNWMDNPTSIEGDAHYERGYFGSSFHPLDVVFPKSNRKIYQMKHLDRFASLLIVPELGHHLGDEPVVRSYLSKLARRRSSIINAELRYRELQLRIEEFRRALRRTFRFRR